MLRIPFDAGTPQLAGEEIEQPWQRAARLQEVRRATLSKESKAGCPDDVEGPRRTALVDVERD